MFTPTPLRRTYAAALRDLRSTRPAVRESAAQELALVGGGNAREAADALAPLVDDSSGPVRVAALHGLAALEARHLLEVIAGRFDDPVSEVRQAAVIALAEIGGERAREALGRACTHPQVDVRYQALLGLCKVDPPSGLAAALASLGNDDPWIAAEAAEQLGLLAEMHPALVSGRERAEVLEALGRAVAEPRTLRIAACANLSLARLGQAEAFAALASFIAHASRTEGDDVAMLVQDAVEVLGRAPPEHAALARTALGPYAAKLVPSLTRTLARASLARLGDRGVVAEVVAGIDAFWQGRRLECVQVARRARLREAVGPLAARLQRGDTDPVAIVEALGEIGGPAARATLEGVAREGATPELREAAREACDRLDPEHRA